MNDCAELIFFHAPNTRSGSVRILLEELGAPCRLHALDLNAGEASRSEHLVVNPLGKVPTLVDGTEVVTERMAIHIHLADRFAKAALAPPIGDRQRGPYLRWLAFYGACFEPAVIDRYCRTHRRPMPPRPTVISTLC